LESKNEFGSQASITVISQVLMESLSKKMDIEMLRSAINVGDYQGMDVEAISKRLAELVDKNPKEVLIALTFGVKNGGIMNAANLDRYSGSEALRQTVSALGLTVQQGPRAAGVKIMIPKNAITISRMMTFFHVYCIDIARKLNLPPAAGVDFAGVNNNLFKSIFAPYLISEAVDKDGLVKDACLEYGCAHHDQINPEKVGVVRPKFNKTIFDLKIRSSCVPAEGKVSWTLAIMVQLQNTNYFFGKNYPSQVKRSGYEIKEYRDTKSSFGNSSSSFGNAGVSSASPFNDTASSSATMNALFDKKGKK